MVVPAYSSAISVDQHLENSTEQRYQGDYHQRTDILAADPSAMQQNVQFGIHHGPDEDHGAEAEAGTTMVPPLGVKPIVPSRHLGQEQNEEVQEDEQQNGKHPTLLLRFADLNPIAQVPHPQKDDQRIKPIGKEIPHFRKENRIPRRRTKPGERISDGKSHQQDGHGGKGTAAIGEGFVIPVVEQQKDHQ
jgi:hypothetical protein